MSNPFVIDDIIRFLKEKGRSFGSAPICLKKKGGRFLKFAGSG